MTDCLIVGNNDSNFAEYLEMVRSMGTESGAYQDLFLAYVNYQGQPCRALDIMTHLHYEGREKDNYRPFHNMDFLWATIPYLGSYLAKRGFTFDYINSFQMEKEQFRDKLLSGDLLSIAVTTTLYVVPHPVVEIVNFIRKYNQTVKIIIGGPHVQNQVKLAQDQETMRHFFKYVNADYYVISSEGEATLAQLLTAIKHGGTLEAINNLAYRKGDEFVMTPSQVESNSLSDEMVNYSLFKNNLGEMVSLRTAKSCPFSCAFCGFPERAGEYTYMSVDEVEQELDRLAALPSVNTLTILDDTFNVPKKRYKDLLRLMIRKKYGFKWWANYRSDHGDAEAVELMGESGCEGVFLGVESGSDTMLKYMNKSARRADYMSAIPLLKKAGIWTHASLIIGFPGETKDTVAETASFLEEAQPDSFRTLLWYADPVTPIWHRKEEFGIKGEAFNWSHSTMDYREACDLINRFFLSTQSSIWLPQYGFELWSVFYLMRRGMTRDQIKDFLRAFNRVIKEEIIFPDKQEATPALIAHLRQSCQYDIPHRNRVDASTLYRPEHYLAAERFWLDEFHTPVEKNLQEFVEDMPQPGEAQDKDGTAIMSLALDGAVADKLRAACTAHISLTLLATYSAVLSRLSGREDTAVVATIGTKDAQQWVMPVRTYPSWDLPFAAFLAQVEDKVTQAVPYHLYGFHFLTNAIRLGERGCPVFDAAFRFTHLAQNATRGDLEDVLKYYPDVTHDIALELCASEEGDQLCVEFRYKTHRFTRETLERLAALVLSALEEVSMNAQLRIDTLTLGQETLPALELDAAPTFNF